MKFLKIWPFLAAIICLVPVVGSTQDQSRTRNARVILAMARVTPAQRPDFEYDLLLRMRGKMPVTPKGVGTIADQLASLAAAGKMNRSQAIEIAQLVATFSSFERNHKDKAAYGLSDLLDSVLQIAGDTTMNRGEKGQLLKTVKGLK